MKETNNFESRVSAVLIGLHQVCGSNLETTQTLSRHVLARHQPENAPPRHVANPQENATALLGRRPLGSIEQSLEVYG